MYAIPKENPSEVIYFQKIREVYSCAGFMPSYDSFGLVILDVFLDGASIASIRFQSL